MKKIAERYFQYEQEFISLTLDHATISEHSKVLVYGDSKYGYQRDVNTLHLNRMVSTLKNGEELLSPTSILLGVSPDQINKTLKPIKFAENNNNNINNHEGICIFDVDKINFDFRIIDGQHRIRAFDKVLKDKNVEKSLKEKLKKYIFNVIIVVIPEDDRIQEVELFRTINSKAKPLKTDLAMLAKYNYEVMYKEYNIDYKSHIKTRIIFYLNDDDLRSEYKGIWTNGIKVDVTNPKSFGSVGFKAFGDSIDKIVSMYIETVQEDFDAVRSEVESIEEDYRYKIIDDLLEKSTQIILNKIIIPAWDIIYNKWPKAFEKNIIVSEETESIKFYNKEYYIQQTMGVKALNGLLVDCYEKSLDFEQTIKHFENIILNSNLTETEWLKGGAMKGLSSESGFNIIREMIKS